jgi:hypothetical protein
MSKPTRTKTLPTVLTEKYCELENCKLGKRGERVKKCRLQVDEAVPKAASGGYVAMQEGLGIL